MRLMIIRGNEILAREVGIQKEDQLQSDSADSERRICPECLFSQKMKLFIKFLSKWAEHPKG